jgi:hypothetical protein
MAWVSEEPRKTGSVKPLATAAEAVPAELFAGTDLAAAARTDRYQAESGSNNAAPWSCGSV